MILFSYIQLKNATATKNTDGARPKPTKPNVPTIKLDESYNTDKDLPGKEDFGDYKPDRSNNQDIPSQSTAVYTRVRNKFFYKINIYFLGK